MSLTCIIVAGTLWMTDGEHMVQPVNLVKREDSTTVSVTGTNTRTTRMRSSPDQSHMNVNQFLADCIGLATVLNNSIDDGECTGMDETCE